MTDEEIYSPEELRAFHLVGEFLGWFARLEAVIDQSVIDILELEPKAGQLFEFLFEVHSVAGTGLSGWRGTKRERMQRSQKCR